MRLVSAQELTTTRVCTAYACTSDATGEDGFCDDHRARIDGEYRRGVKGARKYTPAGILEEVRRWTREKGAPPRAIDWQANAEKRGGYPSYNAAVDIAYTQGWGGWRGLLERAGVLDAAGEPVVPPLAAVPPPVADPEPGHDEGQNPPPIAPEPAADAALPDAEEGHLVALARAVEEADAEYGRCFEAMQKAEERIDAAVAALRQHVEAQYGPERRKEAA